MIARPALIPALLAWLRGPQLAPEALADHRSRLLRRLVRHAGERVPFYRRLFEEHGVRPEDLRTPDDLRRLPIVDRSHLRGLVAGDLVARGLDPDRLISRRTSGSSGEPFRIYRTWLEQNLAHLYRLRAHRAVGFPFSGRIASVTTPKVIHPRDSKRAGRALAAIAGTRRARIDMYAEPPAILEALASLRPDAISGYPGVLARVADVAREHGGLPPPRIVLTGAETLTPPLRRRIEEGFRTRVFDFYGCHEVNLVAWECPVSGLLHTPDDATIVEVVCDGRPAAEGETGEVVLTSLHHYAMPFVRYRLSDLAVRGPARCPCGSSFGTLTRVVGRTFDDFVLRGRRIHAQQIGKRIVDAAPWIGQYQLEQEREDRVVLRVTPEPENASPDLEPLRAAATDALGPGVELEILLTRDFPREANGKIRVLRSLVGREA